MKLRNIEEDQFMSLLGTTLSRHIIEEAHRLPDLAGPLASLLTQISYAAKILSVEISRAALVGKLGLIGEKNATGDSQKKLDVFSNDIILEAFVNTNLVSAIASEELAGPCCLSGNRLAPYVLSIDPLDGSSNVDVNGDLGTIFGIYKRDKDDGCSEDNFFRKGTEQVGAGYVLYGASTIFVYTVGQGVYGFTLDRQLGEFLLSHEKLQCPNAGKTYSANLSNLPHWSAGIQKYVQQLMQDNSKKHSLRYNGALVADFHRCLIEGGIYFYPGDNIHQDGKLRLLYECAPLAFIAEQAGARATTGSTRILDIQIDSIHQRSPFVIGSTDEVAKFENIIKLNAA